MKDKAAQTLSQLAVKKRRELAAVRREKVKILKEKGYTAPKIAEELDIKVRTVYHDFSILKRESETELE